jgi:hypothetical protein
MISSVMVGRDTELNKLDFQVMKAVNGEGSIVNVIGEAGIGKSRLIAELKKSPVMKSITFLELRKLGVIAEIYGLYLKMFAHNQSKIFPL